MSTIAEILDRLSGIAIVKERLAETSRNADRSLTWLLDHEKRLIRLEIVNQVATPITPEPAPGGRPRRLRGK